MGLDIWFKDDIANILRAADEANLSAMAAASRDDPHVLEGATYRLRQAHRDGFAAALATVALALGLPVPTLASRACPHSMGHTREVTTAGVPRLVDPLRR